MKAIAGETTGTLGLVRRKLLTGAGGGALALACLFPSTAWAGSYTANSAAELAAAIDQANADADAGANITLGSSFTVTDPLPAATKLISIELNGNVLTNGNTVVQTASGLAGFKLTNTSSDADSQLVNTGFISGAGTSVPGNLGGIGIDGSKVTVINSGTISGGASNDFTGTIGNAAAGVSLFAGGALINSGTVVGGNSQGAGAGAGVYSDGGIITTATNITNTSTGIIRGGSDLTGNGAGQVGIVGHGSAPLAIDNDGLIEGGNGAAAIAADTGQWNVSIVNKGTIRAGAGGVNAIDSGGAIGSLTLEMWAGSTIEGNVIASSTGADTLRLGGTVDSSFDISQAGPAAKYQGFDEFAKAGTSTWTLTGDSVVPTNWTIEQGTLIVSNGGAGSMQFGRLTNNDTLIIDRDGATSIAGQMLGSGATYLNGSGVTTLGGNNPYSGDIFLNNGTLSVGDNGNLGAAGSLLSVNGGTLQWTGATATLARPIDWGANGGGFDVAGTSTLTVNQALTNGGALTKSGTGALTLTGDNTYIGGTTINAGTLAIGIGGTSGSVLGDIVDNGTLSFSRSDGYTYAGAITGIGALTKFSAGTLTFTGHSNYGGVTTLSGGQLLVAAGGTVASGGATSMTNQSATLAVDGAGSAFSTASINLSASTGRTLAINVTNGGLLQTTTGGIGIRGTLATPRFTIDGTGSLADLAGGLTAASLANSSASVTISGGGALHTGGASTVGTAAGNVQNGTTRLLDVSITGAGSNWTSTSSLLMTNGNFTVDQGGAASFTDATFGTASAHPAAVTVTGAGSSLTTTGDLTIGSGAGTGVLTLADGGRLGVGGMLTLGDADTATATLNIGGAEDEAAAAAGVLDQTTIDLGSTNSQINFNHTDPGFTFTGPITGTGKVNQMAGTTILSGDSSYTGDTIVDGGTLRINGDQSLATGLTSVAGGATIGGSGTIGGDVTIADGGILAPGNSPGTLTINGDLALSGGSLLNYEFGHSDEVGGPLNDLTVVKGKLTLAGTINVDVTPGGSFDTGLYRVISYGTLDNQGLALGTMPADSNVLLQTSIANQINLVNVAGADVNFWDGNGARGDNVVTGGDGTWQASGGNDNWTSTDGGLNAKYFDSAFAIFSAAPGTVTVDDSLGAVTASGIQFAGDGYLLSGGDLALTGPQSVIRVGDGTTVGAGFTATIASRLTGTSDLEKTDLGTLVLTGANNYAGATNVNAGTLLVDGDQTAATAITTVLSGATLGGSGTVGGDVDVLGGGSLAPGDGVGKLTINGDLTLTDGAILNYEFGQANVAGGTLNDVVEVGGDLTLDGTINVAQSAGGTFGPGIYRVFDYDGALTDNGLVVGMLPGGVGAATVQTSVAGQVNLVDTTGVSLNFWDGAAGPKNNHAIDGGNGVWQLGSTSDNWTNSAGSLNAGYSNGAVAIFAGTGGKVTVDDGLGQVTAAGLQFAADGYTIDGNAVELIGPQSTIRVGDGSTAGAGFTATIAAALSGDSQLVKTDGGTLVLGGANTYTGGTEIDGGTLRIASDANLGATTGNVTLNGGTLATSADVTSGRMVTLAGAGTIATADTTTFTLNGPLAGTGALTKAGGGTLLLTGDDSGYTGATRVEAGTLAVTGSFGGATTVGSGSRLEGTGQVGSVVNAGTVAPGRGIGTLTVAGGYAGSDGRLEIEASLGGDGSQADRLVVNGGTSGSTTIDVINRGGLGAQTSEGIKVVDVTGASAGTFTLQGDYDFEGKPALIAGAYGYQLFQGGTSTPSDGDWYLRSSLLDAAGAPPAPIYQPGVPLYENYASTLQTLNRVSTLQERVGNRQWSGTTQSGFGMWGRIEGERYRPEAAISTSGADLDVDDWTMQIGLDKGVLASAQGTLIAGVNVRYGKADAQVRSAFGNGDIDTDGYGVGATLTWYGSTGFYADAQAQANWSRTDLKSALLGKLVDDNHGSGEAFSLELGKQASLGGGLSVTPQVQMAYSNVRFDPFADPAGATISSDKADSLRTRWGVSLDHEATSDGSNGKKQSHVYGIVNLTYEWLDGNVTDVSGTPILNRDDRLWGELGLGGSYSWADSRYTLYTEVSADTAISDFGDSNSLRGSAGFRMRF